MEVDADWRSCKLIYRFLGGEGGGESLFLSYFFYMYSEFQVAH